MEKLVRTLPKKAVASLGGVLFFTHFSICRLAGGRSKPSLYYSSFSTNFIPNFVYFDYCFIIPNMLQYLQAKGKGNLHGNAWRGTKGISLHRPS